VPPGRLIVFEGAEGVGKTTQIRRLGEQLTERGVPYLSVREPGGTGIGNEIRRLVLQSDHDMSPRAEALLFMASRAELVERNICPALAAGNVVIADRFFLSTYANQIAGRGLAEHEVIAANSFATGGLVPDLTILLDMPVQDALARTDRRGARDRMESSDDAFHQRVSAAFSRFAQPEWQAAHRESGPIVSIDAQGSVDEVGRRVLSALEQAFPETFHPTP